MGTQTASDECAAGRRLHHLRAAHYRSARSEARGGGILGGDLRAQSQAASGDEERGALFQSRELGPATIRIADFARAADRARRARHGRAYRTLVESPHPELQRLSTPSPISKRAIRRPRRCTLTYSLFL